MVQKHSLRNVQSIETEPESNLASVCEQDGILFRTAIVSEYKVYLRVTLQLYLFNRQSLIVMKPV